MTTIEERETSERETRHAPPAAGDRWDKEWLVTAPVAPAVAPAAGG